MSDYYENVDRRRLWHRARAANFSLVILCVALNQYQAQRFVAHERATVSTGHPTRGIAAGCSWATFLVQVYTCKPFADWQLEHPRLPLSLFIDDLHVGITDDDLEDVVRTIRMGAVSLIKVIEDELGCSVAQRKSITLANSVVLRRRLAKALGPIARRVAPSAKNLGVDLAVGNLRSRKSSRPALRERMRKLTSRKRRLAALRRAGTDMRKLFTSGLASYGTYGAEVTGVDDAELRKLQSSFLAIAGSRGDSRSRSISLALLQDPT